MSTYRVFAPNYIEKGMKLISARTLSDCENLWSYIAAHACVLAKSYTGANGDMPTRDFCWPIHGSVAMNCSF